MAQESQKTEFTFFTNPTVDEKENIVIKSNPFLKIQEGFDFMELSKLYEDFHKREIITEEDREEFDTNRKKMVSLRNKIEKARTTEAKPINDGLRKLKAHGDSLQSVVLKVETLFIDKLSDYDKAEAEKVAAELEQRRSVISDFWVNIESEIKTCQTLDDTDFIHEQINSWECTREKYGDLYDYAIDLKNLALGNLMIAQRRLMQPKESIQPSANVDSQPIESVTNKDYSAGFKGVHIPSSSKPSPKTGDVINESPLDKYSELYQCYSFGRFGVYESLLNKLTKFEIYQFLRWCNKNTQLDVVQTTELLRFLK